MRILTNSPFNLNGLISIGEATDDAPQRIIFCIPLERYRAEEINTLTDFNQYFRSGIKTKIKNHNIKETIKLDFHSNSFYGFRQKNSLPFFAATIKGHRVNFYISQLNFLNYNVDNRLTFDFYYDGRILNDLYDKRFVILEPNWKQLDELYIESEILFSDWV